MVGWRSVFSTLTPAQLDIIHQTAYEAGLYSQKITTEQDATMLKTMQEQGVEIIYPDVAPFKEKALKSINNSRNGPLVCMTLFSNS